MMATLYVDKQKRFRVVDQQVCRVLLKLNLYQGQADCFSFPTLA